MESFKVLTLKNDTDANKDEDKNRPSKDPVVFDSLHLDSVRDLAGHSLERILMHELDLKKQSKNGKTG